MVEKPLLDAVRASVRPIVEDERRLNLFWRIALVFTAVTLVWLGIHTFVNTTFGADYTRETHIIRAVLTSLIVIPLIVAARRFLDVRSWAGLGLSPLRIGWRPLLTGMICWIIPAAIGLIAALVLGWTEIAPRAPLSDIILTAAGLLVLVFIYEALPEELIFRGYFYRNLGASFPRWAAVLGQAILFVLWGLANGGPVSLERSWLFFTAAIVMGIFRVVSGSLWASIGFHLAFQTIVQLFSSIGNQFTISEPQVLMVFAFGILPFALSLSIHRMFYKPAANWGEPDPDTTRPQPHLAS